MAQRTGTVQGATDRVVGVPRIDVDKITDQAVRRGARRAVERALAAIEGTYHVAGRYYANEFDADRARTVEAERILNNIARRSELYRTAFGDTEWEADDFAAHMQERIMVERLGLKITRTVVCPWCEREGVPAVIHEGNAALSVSYRICLRHAGVLLEHAGLCEENT